MSFPYHDGNWRSVADFILAHRRETDRILANDIFWWRFDEIFRYSNLHLDPAQDYDWVVVHKGELGRFPVEFLERLTANYLPVFANPVFVLWTRRDDIPPLGAHPDLSAFDGLIEEPKAQAFQPLKDDGIVLPIPRRIGKFETLNKVQLAEVMDRFFAAGGYVYETLRDQVFYAEIDRWLKTLWNGLEDADALDVACGNGRVASVVVNFRSFVETDLSPVAVDLARAAGAGDPRRRAEIMDAETLDFPDATFDAVTFIEGAEHVHDFERAISEAVRVLRPGGRFILNAANGDSLHQRINSKLGYPYFRTNYQHICELSWARTKSILESAGLAIERAEGIFLYPYWGVPGVDQYVRRLMDHDPEMVEIMRSLGEKAGPGLAYCAIARARKL